MSPESSFKNLGLIVVVVVIRPGCCCWWWCILFVCLFVFTTFSVLNEVSNVNRIEFQFLSMTFKDLHDLGPKILLMLPPICPTFHSQLNMDIPHTTKLQVSCSLRIDLSTHYSLFEILLILSSNTTSYTKTFVNFHRTPVTSF